MALTETKEEAREQILDYSEENSSIVQDTEFAEQRDRLMNLLEACDDTIDYKEMDDQLETMRKNKNKGQGQRDVRELRKEYVDNTKLNSEYKA